MDIYVVDSNNEDGKDQWQEPCRLKIQGLGFRDIRSLQGLKASMVWV